MVWAGSTEDLEIAIRSHRKHKLSSISVTRRALRVTLWIISILRGTLVAELQAPKDRHRPSKKFNAFGPNGN